ncbi:MAG: NAD(P)-dependent oxidoreductase [Opitutaceae bacterium]|nr:NAD(P)-dependent oxidoreductase [Opitutaceae bacterium]
MNIAITGATGFIGGHLLRELAATPHTLAVITRPSSPTPTLPARVTALPFDLTGAGADAFARLGSPDLLIHLAWGALGDFQSPAHMTDELPLHFNFLRALVTGGLPRLVVVGTCFEYGLQNGGLSEDAPCDPVTWYGLAKLSLLRQLQLLQRAHPFELLWPRLFYLHGDGQPRNSIHAQLMRAIAAGDREFPMSAGEQLRDYLPVTEVARLLARLATSPATGVVNVCSGRPVSLRRQVETWIAERGASIVPLLGRYPYRDYEPLAFWGSTRRLQTLLPPAGEKKR